jgi:hypothetical protein
MILTNENINKVEGKFKKFEYLTTIFKTESNKHFKCFQDIDSDVFEMKCDVFCTSENGFMKFIEETNDKCRGLLGYYFYKPLFNKVETDVYFTPMEVFEYFLENKKNLPLLISYGMHDVIQ